MPDRHCLAGRSQFFGVGVDVVRFVNLRRKLFAYDLARVAAGRFGDRRADATGGRDRFDDA